MQKPKFEVGQLVVDNDSGAEGIIQCLRYESICVENDYGEELFVNDNGWEYNIWYKGTDWILFDRHNRLSPEKLITPEQCLTWKEWGWVKEEHISFK